MPAYNYKPRFVPYIQDGSKFHTIRAIRRYPAKPGDTLSHYTGLRTKYTKKIIEPTLCTAAKSVFIFPAGDMFILDKIITGQDREFLLNDVKDDPELLATKHGARKLRKAQKNMLAYHDGFRINEATTKELADVDPHSNFTYMLHFWQSTHSLPFAGHIIVWHPQPEKIIYLNK